VLHVTSLQLTSCAILALVAVQLAHPLPDPLVELIAQRFRVLAEPMRIRLLDRLRDGEATVGDLVQATASSQQNVSKHLRVLLEAGLVARRQDGNFARYSIADQTVFAICEQVCGGLRTRLEELDAMLGGGVTR
jgi:DNA-binding transcriptional ArsR family regulator